LSSSCCLNVVSGEEDSAGDALRHQVLDLLLGGLVHDRRARDRHQRQREVVLARGADREPAEVAELGHGDVGTNLEADLVGPEVEGLLLVVDPHVSFATLIFAISVSFVSS